MTQPLIPQRPDHAQAHALRIELAQLRATTPVAGRQLHIAALIRAGRDGR